MKKHSVLVNNIYKESIAIQKRDGVGSDDVPYANKRNEHLSNISVDNKERML
ncbi:MAG: hypothetical protein JXQ96_18375 [Cyclobacteriaceae bacterium]